MVGQRLRGQQHLEQRRAIELALYANLLDHLLDAMRIYAVEHPTVLHRTLDLLAQVGHARPDAATRRRMAEHADRGEPLVYHRSRYTSTR